MYVRVSVIVCVSVRDRDHGSGGSTRKHWISN
jgi:hypothetical protein